MPVIPQSIPHTVDAIYRTYEKETQNERPYLGASTFGTECERAHWYSFRWANEPEQLTGRKLRLFATGHREEARIIDDLRNAGIEITGQQTSFSAIGGHLRGHLDGIATNMPEAPKARHVLEVKTHNEKSYKDLLKNGVKKSKPGHYAQMQLYMHHTRIDRALYVAVNKNDDSLYTERVEYDKDEADRLMRRAERTIFTDAAPPRLETFACAWCPSKSICLEGDASRRNCRTCISSTPAERGMVCERCGKKFFEYRRAETRLREAPLFAVPSSTASRSTLTRTSVPLPTGSTDGREWTDGV